MDRIELAGRLEELASSMPLRPDRQALRQAAAALRESEEWRRDAERYRWLRNDASRHSNYDGSPSPWIVFGTDLEDACAYYEQDLDAAIDAARKEG